MISGLVKLQQGERISSKKTIHEQTDIQHDFHMGGCVLYIDDGLWIKYMASKNDAGFRIQYHLKPFI